MQMLLGQVLKSNLKDFHQKTEKRWTNSQE